MSIAWEIFPSSRISFSLALHYLALFIVQVFHFFGCIYSMISFEILVVVLFPWFLHCYMHHWYIVRLWYFLTLHPTNMLSAFIGYQNSWWCFLGYFSGKSHHLQINILTFSFPILSPLTPYFAYCSSRDFKY